AARRSPPTLSTSPVRGVLDVFERSDARGVTRHILTLPRLTAVASAGCWVSATISLAADKPVAHKPAAHSAKRQVLVVPDVRGQVFVFASGALEDGGLWLERRGVIPCYSSRS